MHCRRVSHAYGYFVYVWNNFDVIKIETILVLKYGNSANVIEQIFVLLFNQATYCTWKLLPCNPPTLADCCMFLTGHRCRRIDVSSSMPSFCQRVTPDFARACFSTITCTHSVCTSTMSERHKQVLISTNS